MFNNYLFGTYVIGNDIGGIIEWFHKFIYFAPIKVTTSPGSWYSGTLVYSVLSCTPEEDKRNMLIFYLSLWYHLGNSPINMFHLGESPSSLQLVMLKKCDNSSSVLAFWPRKKLRNKKNYRGKSKPPSVTTRTVLELKKFSSVLLCNPGVTH
jgi:hypothetical protein